MPGAARVTDIGSSHDCFPDSAVTAGSPDTLINGHPAARVGDPLAPHGCTCSGGHGLHPRSIAAGSSTVFINGKAATRIGDGVSCGGCVSTGSGNVIIGDTPYKSPVHQCAADAVKNHNPLLGIPFIDDPRHYIRFRCVNDDAQPFIHARYSLYFADGHEESGFTDEKGRTQWHYADDQDNVHLHMLTD